MQIPSRELTPDDLELIEFARRTVDANTDGEDGAHTMGAAHTIGTHAVLGVSVVALGMVLTPGPYMMCHRAGRFGRPSGDGTWAGGGRLTVRGRATIRLARVPAGR